MSNLCSDLAQDVGKPLSYILYFWTSCCACCEYFLAKIAKLSKPGYSATRGNVVLRRHTSPLLFAQHTIHCLSVSNPVQMYAGMSTLH